MSYRIKNQYPFDIKIKGEIKITFIDVNIYVHQSI